MDDEQLRSGEHSTLFDALNRLAADRGVWSNDLPERLSDKLRTCWGIDQSEHEVVTIRKHVVANLQNHIENLESVTASRKNAYIRAVSVGFNVYDGVDLKATNPTTRRKWVETQPDKDYRASERSSRIWLEHAINQIERSLVSGKYEPVLPGDFPAFGLPPSKSSKSPCQRAPSLDKEGASYDDTTSLEVPQSKKLLSTRKQLSTALAVVVMIATATAIAFVHVFGNSAPTPLAQLGNALLVQTFSPYPECVFDGCGVTVGDVPGVSITTERRDRSLISGCPPRRRCPATS